MNAGVLLKMFRDVVNALESAGVLLPDGSFDQSKLDTVQEDVAFGAQIEAILKAHGVPIPGKVDKIVAILPLLWGLVGA